MGIAKFYGVLSNSFARTANLSVFRDTNSHCADARLLQFPKNAAGSSLGASRSSKTFPDLPKQSSVYQAGRQDGG